MTLSEVLLWNEPRRKQMLGYDFHRQKPIDAFVVDFFCPRLSLAIEIDGASHEGRQEADSERQRDIERYGISFLRFPDREVKQNLNGVLECIREWIVAHESERGAERCAPRSVGSEEKEHTPKSPLPHTQACASEGTG
jgi:very-short-patch-repair endonuclease